MRHTLFSPLLVALLLSQTVHAQWIDKSGRPRAATESMKSSGNFGVHIVLTADDEKFREVWNRSTAPPSLQSTSTVRRGAPISAMILFHGCAPARIGNCDATVSFTVIAPDGKVTNAGGGPLWTNAPLQGRILLSNASVTIAFDKTDPIGTYKVRATATDKVSGKTIQVSAPFTLL